MNDIPDTDPDIIRIQAALDTLSEHFGAVMIFATRYESEAEGNGPQGTVAIVRGCGDWYSRYGLVNEWIIRQNERSKMKEREP